MTSDADIFNEYMRREMVAQLTIAGADHDQIISDIADKHDMTPEQVRKIIKKNSPMWPN